MTIDLATIPAERLALLDTAVIYNGSHGGFFGGPDCKHCARELLHEVVTGEHRDATPPGCTALMAILPRLNDGPWRDDAHRTDVMRPYLRKLLALDPARDEERIYAIIDHVCRSILPEICDALGLAKEGSALRALAPIVDKRSALAALAALTGAALEARVARAALAGAARAAHDAADAHAALTALYALCALDARGALADLDIAARTARVVRAALAAAVYVRDALDVRVAIAARDDDRADAWECGTRALLDLICDIQ